jgi:RNA polymerase sigma-70 factor (ECF subfamily)
VDWQNLSPDRLVYECHQGNDSYAWREFMRRYHPVLSAAAIRVSRRWGNGEPVEVDDVIQEIYLRLCENRCRALMSFRDPRPEAMFGFLKVSATHIAHDFFRRRAAAKRGYGQTIRIDEASALFTSSADIEKQITLAEIEKILLEQTRDGTGPRDRGIFRLYFRQGMTSRAIANIPGVGLNTKGVEAVIYRLTKVIREEMK